MSKNPRDGFWYWMTLTKPANYWIAKSLGGEAEEQADAAMEDMAPVAAVMVVVLLIIGAVWGVGHLFGAW